MRKVGRHINDRMRAMRFALWAQSVPLHLLTARQISGLLDVHPTTAEKWRRDLMHALSPMEIDGIPGFLTPNPEASYIATAATSAKRKTTRS